MYKYILDIATHRKRQAKENVLKRMRPLFRIGLKPLCSHIIKASFSPQ